MSSFVMAQLDEAIAKLRGIRSKRTISALPVGAPFDPSSVDLTHGVIFAGVRVVTSTLLSELRQHSRSPSRAKRRAALGHKQHFVLVPSSMAYRIGPRGSETIVMHPAQFKGIKARINAEARGPGFVVGRKPEADDA